MNATPLLLTLSSAGLLWAAFAAGPASAEPKAEGGADKPKNEVKIAVSAEFRTIQSNGWPEYQPEFPRRGNPNTATPQRYQFRVPVKPEALETPVRRGGFWWGVALNGVPFEPGTGETWNNNPQSGWRYEAGTGFLNLGLDEHHAHVQPTGAYHYHALPTGLVERLGGDGETMRLIGWAADGFPLYTGSAHVDPKDPKSPLRVMKSSYRLKPGARPAEEGGPGGNHDGRFTQDFEFAKGSGDLDECNGRTGVTPEFPEGTYYYCVSGEFPFVPRLWRGEPDASFFKNDRPPGGGPRGGAGGPAGERDGQPGPPPGGTPPSPIMIALDANKDGELDADEIANARAALLTLDKDGDGKVGLPEHRPLPRPGRGGSGGPPQPPEIR